LPPIVIVIEPVTARLIPVLLLGTLATACRNEPLPREVPPASPAVLVANTSPAMSDSARAEELHRAHQDSVKAGAIARALEGASFEVWFDERIHSGSELRE